MRGRARRGARHAAAAGLLAVVLAGCATTRSAPPVAAPIAPAQAAELARRWAAEWEGFPGMRAAIDLTVKTRRGSDRAAALLLMAPTALRVEVATPFGLPALVATAGPDDITIFSVLERRAQTARPSPAAVERWLGVALPPIDADPPSRRQRPASGRPRTWSPSSARRAHISPGPTQGSATGCG